MRPSSNALPLGHLLTELNVIVYLKSEGTLYRAEKLKLPAKEKMLICIPCTDESEARSGTKAIDFPHPLFDQIKYLTTHNYLNNLRKWMDFLQDNPKYSCLSSNCCSVLLSCERYIIERF